MVATFQHVQESHDIGVDVSIRILNAVTHARLSCEMTDDIELLIGEKFLELVAVGNVHFRKTTALRTLDDLIQQDFVNIESALSESREFQVNIIVGR